jgi:hypothetical protein
MRFFFPYTLFLTFGFNLFAADPSWKWAKSVGGKGYDRASCVISTPENVFWSGLFSDSIIFGNTVLVPKSEDAFLIKSDAKGEMVWILQCGGIGSQMIHKIDKINSNNSVIVGSFSESLNIGDYNFASTGKQDGFISKINENGSPLWVKIIKGLEDNVSNLILTDAQSNVYVSGYFKGLLIFENDTLENESVNNYSSFIIKLNSNGEKIWTKKIGGLQYSNVFIYGMDKGSNDSIIMAGSLLGFPSFDIGDTLEIGNKSNGFLAKMDKNGNFSWVKPTGEFSGQFSNIAVDAEENIFVTGNFGYNSTHSAVLDTITIFSSGNFDDIVVAKFNKNANIQWAKVGGSIGFQDQPLDIEVNNNGDTYIGGWFGGDKLIWQTDTLFSFGGGDIFILKLNTQGKLVWLKQAGGPHNDDVEEITDIDLQNGNIFCVGNFTTSCYFDTILLENGVNGNGFLAVLNESELTNIESEPNSFEKVLVFPNPTNRFLSILGMDSGLENIEYSIFDIYGKILKSESYNGMPISVEQLQNGIYFIKIKQLEKTGIFKFIVE